MRCYSELGQSLAWGKCHNDHSKWCLGYAPSACLCRYGYLYFPYVHVCFCFYVCGIIEYVSNKYIHGSMTLECRWCGFKAAVMFIEKKIGSAFHFKVFLE